MTLRNRCLQVFSGDPDRLFRHVLADFDPNGKPQAMVRCPFHEDHTPSLSITLTGERAGCWFCHGCKMGGDVFDLVARFKNLNVKRQFRDVCQERALILGISPDDGKAAQGKIVATYDYTDGAGALLFGRKTLTRYVLL